MRALATLSVCVYPLACESALSGIQAQNGYLEVAPHREQRLSIVRNNAVSGASDLDWWACEWTVDEGIA